MTLKPYPAYKDSGVPWLGEVPVHWSLRSLSSLLTRTSARNRPDLPLLSVVREKGVVLRASMTDTENHNFVPDDLSNYRVVKRGSLVINKMKSWQGSLGVSEYDGIVSPAYFVFDCNFANRQYLHRLLRSRAYVPLFAQASDGIRVDQWDLSIDRMKRIPIADPPADEQTAIVRYLDHVDRRIRHTIRAKQRLIALLNEQKQAIIHQAVTRGLDPNVRLKPSGVAWLGDVPEHWEIRRNGSLFRERIERGDPEWPILVVSLRTGVTIGDDEDEDGRPRRLIENRTSYKRAVVGDIAYNMMRMWQGAVGVARVNGLVSPAYVVAAPHEGVESRFFSFLFRTDDFKAAFNRVSTGIVSDRNRLYWDDFKALPSPVPPLEEQQQIVTAIDRQCAHLDEVIAGTHQQISLLREYRTRLIADVVTGKLDVRDAAATLPDEVEDAEALDEEEATADDAEPLDETESDAATDEQ